MTNALAFILVATLLAPLLAVVARRYGFMRAGLDGFVLMTVVGLVVLVLVPDAVFHRGGWAVFFVILGFVLPAIAENIAHYFEKYLGKCQNTQYQTHRLILLISVCSIIFHAMMDGALLALSHVGDTSFFMTAGLIAHRLGITITIWWLLIPYMSRYIGYLVLVLFAFATYLGFQMAASVMHITDSSLMGLWQAFAAGSLLHVALHPLRDRNIPLKTILISQRVGTILALFFIIVGIYSTFQSSDHTVQAVANVIDHSHTGVQESLYVMQQAGILAAPWFVLMIIVGGLYKVRYNLSVLNYIDCASRLAAVTFIVWLSLSVLYAYFNPHSNHDHYLLISLDIAGLFYVWLLMIGGSLVIQGAPRFFGLLLPDFLAHKHSH